MAVDYKKKIGFKGTFLIEPKPKEPTKHQYDFDAATVLGFLRAYGLVNDFKLNIEANHATLAGHTFEHELTVAAAAGRLGSIDANTGDLLLGWDTDQFPTSVRGVTLAMLVILKQGGLEPGGVNFDAKVRRGSCDTLDLFHAHIGAMDAFARGLLIADRILAGRRLRPLRRGALRQLEERPRRLGAARASSLADLERWLRKQGEPKLKSGRQEMLENLLNSYLE